MDARRTTCRLGRVSADAALGEIAGDDAEIVRRDKSVRDISEEGSD